jgi:hypothetical protein
MPSRKARAAEKAITLKTHHDTLASWVFAFCTLLMLASVVHMWSYWFEVMASFGLYRAAGMLTLSRELRLLFPGG